MALDEGGICEERRKRGEDTDGETMRGLETRRVLSIRSLLERVVSHTETHDTRINRAVTIVSHCSLRFSPMANRLFPSPDPTADQGIPIANLLPGFAIGERSLFCIPAKGSIFSFLSCKVVVEKGERERERVRVRKCPFSRFGNLYL